MKLQTIKDAAKASGIGYDTLRHAVKNGLITVVQLPGQRTPMLDPADVEVFIAAAKVGPVTGTNPPLPEPDVPDFKRLEITRIAKQKKPVLPYHVRFARKNG